MTIVKTMVFLFEKVNEMAVIEFINAKNKQYRGLKNVLNYIKSPRKTEDHLIYGSNVDPENDFNTFITTKQIYNKTEGRQFIHFTQAFSPTDQITNAIAYAAGKELLEHEIFKGYQVVMATHVDREHLHNHFVINTVNSETGEKWQLSQNQLAELKDYSDEICLKYGLSIIDEKDSDRDYKRSIEYRSINEERSWKHELTLAVNSSIYGARNLDQFKENMTKLGYGVEWDYANESDQMRLHGSRIFAAVNHADDIESFKANLNQYGYDVEWKYKLKTSTIDPKSGEVILKEKNFDSEEDLHAELELLPPEVKREWTDDIKYKTPEGNILTPEHFEKQSRFSGNVLRSKFEINLNRDLKPLPDIKSLKLPGTDPSYKRLLLSARAAKQYSFSKEHFIENMKKLGYEVNWEDNRKYIVFKDESGKKIRNRMLAPPKQFTKEAIADTLEFNMQLREIAKCAVNNDFKSFEKEASQRGFELKKDEKKHRYIFKITDDKQCYFNEDAFNKLTDVSNPLELSRVNDIDPVLKVGPIMFTTPDGKKCSNLQLFPKEKFSRQGILDRLEQNEARMSEFEANEKMNLLLSAIRKIDSEDYDSKGSKNAKSFPLSHLEGQALKEKLNEQKKGLGFDWSKQSNER